MPTSLENVVVLPAITQNKTLSNERNNSKIGVDLEVFGAKEIRDVLKSKAHCLRAGFSSNHVIILTLNEIRDHYIMKVGLPTYLSQMLGELATVSIQYCSLYDEAGHRLELKLNPTHHQPLQKFINQQYGAKKLPFRIEGRKDLNSDKIEVRYL
ncbi:MAG: hypothetical protein HC875_22290 [Anaerolineales bacterium]|nr:hypothetical protein [Anaerolineales bacterium]